MRSHLALFPDSASTVSPRVDAVAFALLGLSGFIVLLVFGLMIILCVRYYTKKDAQRKYAPIDNIRLELTWILIPIFLSIGLFAWAAYVFVEMHQPIAGSAEVYVVARQWMWKFQHPDGTRELNELHVPVGQPIELVMTSQDVIHSFFVPAFRVKQDVLPGRYLYTWFEATKPGTYHLFCTQYCGTDHARMRGSVIVMPPADYQKWLASGLSKHEPTIQTGARLFRKLGCVHCHGANSDIRAPNLAGIYGTTVRLRSGELVRADENYLRESILNPDAKIVDGYRSIMPPFQGMISEDELIQLIDYIKSMRAAPIDPDAESGGY